MKNNWKEEFKSIEITEKRLDCLLDRRFGVFRLENLEDFIESLLAEQKKELMGKTNKLIDLYGAPNCDYLHHNKSQYHKGGVFCPVVRETLALIESLKHHD